MDRSVHGELRVVGPHDHLHYGCTGFAAQDFEVDDVKEVGGALQITGKFQLRQPFIPDPAMGHLHWLNQFAKEAEPPTFDDIFARKPKALAPMAVTLTSSWDDHVISYRRLYGNHWYGATLSIGGDIELWRDETAQGFGIKNDHTGWIEYSLVADTDNRIKPAVPKVVKAGRAANSFQQNLLNRTAAEITHLVQNHKTTGCGHGTVSPRDWLAAADLGEFDLTPAARRHMYQEALRHIAPGGKVEVGYAVGELAANLEDGRKAVAGEIRELARADKKIGDYLRPHIKIRPEPEGMVVMADVEPRLVLGLQRLRWSQLEPWVQVRLRQAAAYVIEQATQNTLISVSSRLMRDSLAFDKLGPLAAPYAVNVVFYPEALRVIAANADRLGVDKRRAAELYKQWRGKADWYAYINGDGLPVMAMALHGTASPADFLQLQVDHFDEAYALYYGRPPASQLQSFAKRWAHPARFGQVPIKQAAQATAGLQRQLQRRDLDDVTRQLLQLALTKTCAATLETELAEPSRQVELWSAVGARRIIRAYNEAVKNAQLE